MNTAFRTPALLLTFLLVIASGCVTQKKKGESVGGFRRAYHNLTTKYNYWFNANELFRNTVNKMDTQYADNYNQVLEIYPYMAVDPQSSKSDLDNVAKKAANGIAYHEFGNWKDDCYLLIGQSQFVKRDFETAETTFKYIEEEYAPSKKKLKLAKDKKKKDVKKKKSSKKKKKKVSKKKKKKQAAKKRKAAAKEKAKLKKMSAEEKAALAKKAEEDKKKEEEKKRLEEEKKAQLPTGSNPYDKGVLSRESAYPEAMIWYGRTLIEREKYEEADFLFRDLNEDRWFPKHLRDELATAEASLWMKQKKYDRAIEPLSRAIQLTNKKKQRARLAYILAQLYDLSGQSEQAYAAYQTVLGSRPQFTMEFNARLRQIQAGWENGKISSADAIKSLERMLREDKNKEYRDRIYYTLAAIALKENRKSDAIALLRKSLDANAGDTYQKSESYLKLADLFFDSEDFVHAKLYYDSTLNVLPPTDPRYKRVSAYATNLTDIARHITTITTNDSIMRVYNMSDAERKDLAKAIRKKQEEEKERLEELERQKNPTGTTQAPTNIPAGVKVSFYFYNESYLKKGRKDFGKTWGDRKLEDNWRRSNRQPTGGPGEDVATTDPNQAGASDEEVKNIFQGIPANEGEMAVLHANTYEALFQLGTLFRDKLQNNRKCSGTLEDMQKRYPDTLKHETEAWYYCYLAFSDLGDQARAKYYLDKLNEKYPNSNFTRALTDPNFVNADKAREREMNKYYEQTFNTFQKGQYKDAFERCQDAPKKYGSQNPLMPKFALLSALCTGNLKGNEEYCKALNEVIARYPESAEATRAKEIARLISCKGFEVPTEAEKNKAEIDENFVMEDDKLHYVIVALKGSDISLESVKTSVSDYNREYHKLENLRISNIFLGTDTDAPVVVVRKFDSREQAMKYLKEVKDKKEFLGENNKVNYNKEFFAITQENYRRVLKNKTLDGYREFFEANYMKK